MKKLAIQLQVLMLLLGLAACQTPEKHTSVASEPPVRIVSLAGSLTEILFAAGLGDQVVGVDVTSTYPEAVKSLPQVGHSRNLQAEGILALRPDLLVGRVGEIKPAVEQQLRQAGLRLILLEQEFSRAGTERLIRQLCDTLGRAEAAKGMLTQLASDFEAVEPLPHAPRTLFIYARGAGTLMVAGEGTPLERMVELAGGTPAVSGFSDFKPLSPEALVEANPEVILMFDSGLSSLQGPEGLLEIPGVAQTLAGQHQAFVTMDGQLLAGFGPRLGQAAAQLNAHFRALGRSVDGEIVRR